MFGAFSNVFDNFSMAAFVKSLEMQGGWLSIGIQLCAWEGLKACSAFKISFSNTGEGYSCCHVVMLHLKVFWKLCEMAASKQPFFNIEQTFSADGSFSVVNVFQVACDVSLVFVAY